MHLALYTFGQFKRPSEDPANDDFHALNDPIFELSDETPGMIGRSGYAMDGTPSWGPEVYPRFHVENGDGWAPATLSLWVDIEHLFAFTYFGLHAQALKRGAEWFHPPTWPPLVLWWTHAQPTWAEGVARMHSLHDNGPGPGHFTFKHPYSPDGTATRIDKTRIQSIAQSQPPLAPPTAAP